MKTFEREQTNLNKEAEKERRKKTQQEAALNRAYFRREMDWKGSSESSEMAPGVGLIPFIYSAIAHGTPSRLRTVEGHPASSSSFPVPVTTLKLEERIRLRK